jgi:hypothetical protein
MNLRIALESLKTATLVVVGLGLGVYVLRHVADWLEKRGKDWILGVLLLIFGLAFFLYMARVYG